MNARLTFALMLAPAIVMGQQVSASASAQTDASVNTPPASFSAQSKTQINASFEAARRRNLPTQPMQQRMAEGQARGAAEAQIVTSVQREEARLELAQSAMIKAGRTSPQPREVEAGAQAMEQGATQAQVQAVAQHTPSGRSLVVAFTTLSQLEARGVPVNQAVAQIEAKLDARANDEAIASLASANGSAAGSLMGAANAGGQGKGASVAGTTAAGANAAAGGVGSATAGVAGSVTGVVKKP